MEQNLLTMIMEALSTGGLGPILALVGYHYFYSKKEREKNHESIVRLTGRVEHIESQLNEVKNDNTKTCSQHMQIVNTLVTEKMFNDAITHIRDSLNDIRKHILEINRRVDEIQQNK